MITMLIAPGVSALSLDSGLLARQFAASTPDGGAGGASEDDSLPTVDCKNGVTLDDGHSCCPPGSTDYKSCLFKKYINPFITFLSALVVVVVIIGIIYGAVLVSSSGGDPQKATSGKNHIRNALLGLLAYILFYAFLQFMLPGGKL
jgi:hypothetical protein